MGIYYISNPVPMTVDEPVEQDSIPGLLELIHLLSKQNSFS